MAGDGRVASLAGWPCLDNGSCECALQPTQCTCAFQPAKILRPVRTCSMASLSSCSCASENSAGIMTAEGQLAWSRLNVRTRPSASGRFHDRSSPLPSLPPLPVDTHDAAAAAASTASSPAERRRTTVTATATLALPDATTSNLLPQNHTYCREHRFPGLGLDQRHYPTLPAAHSRGHQKATCAHNMHDAHDHLGRCRSAALRRRARQGVACAYGRHPHACVTK
eukprot:237733-Chlamydomonas_euryale.AAC.6